MGLFWLTLAIVFEVAGTTFMKLSEGLTKVAPTLWMFLCYALSLTALTLTLKRMEVSVAYAIWSGLGTALITMVGYALLKEPLNAVKVSAIALIIAGVVLLNLYGNPH